LPKLVRHTHKNQVSQAWGVTLMFQSEPQSAILCGLPLFHVGGALTQGLAPLSSGQRLVILTPTGYRNPAVIRNYLRLVERDCAVDEIGVVAMSGPGVFAGYMSDQHNRGAWVEEGWVNSGDLGRLDGDGYLWITGRAKDLIIRGGHNIDPLPVEEILYQHPAVELAAVVGQ